MQIVIPMTGLGSRFREQGYENPKPLIEVGGKPMIEYVIKMFPGENDFLFICNRQHAETTPMVDTLKRIKPEGRIYVTEWKGKGPVDSVMEAANQIDDSRPVIVNYCDFYCHWDYPAFKKFVTKTQTDGVIPTYTGFHPHLLGPDCYAGCRIDPNGRVLEIREKHSFTSEKMDSHHSSGTYYFRTGQIMKDYSKKLVSRGPALNGEYYTSLVYQHLLADKRPVHIFEIKKFCQWGTPRDLREYLYWLAYFRPNR